MKNEDVYKALSTLKEELGRAGEFALEQSLMHVRVEATAHLVMMVLAGTLLSLLAWWGLRDITIADFDPMEASPRAIVGFLFAVCAGCAFVALAANGGHLLATALFPAGKLVRDLIGG